MKPSGNARLIRNYEKGKSTSKSLAGRADSRKLVRLAAHNKDRARMKTVKGAKREMMSGTKYNKAKQSLKKLK